VEFQIEKRDEINAKIYGVEYKIRKPTVREAEQMRKSLKKATEDEATEVMMKFLSHLGLPQEAGLEMQADHFVQLCECLSKSEKK